MFSGKCAENHVAMVASIYDDFPDPGRKNPVNIPVNKMRLDSKVIEVDVSSIPKDKSARDLLQCKPDTKLLIRRPLRIRFELKSGRNKSVSDTIGRKLLFHDPDGTKKPSEVRAKYCAVWNTEIDALGAWDTTNIKMVWNNDKVVECTSTAFGTFGIVSEIYEPPSVDKDQNWLMITKYVGYGLSILLLFVFCIMVLLSKHLWEMFHIIGMNFAFALAFADVFMIMAEQDFIRDDHDWCTFTGFGINMLYIAAAALLLFLCFAVFLATTTGNLYFVFLVVFCIKYISGIIGGYTDVYLSLSWGIAFAAFGYNVFMNLDHMGDDPRCFIGWEDQSKTLFAALTLGFGLLSLIMMLVVLCNIHNSALRRRVFVEELASLSQG